MAEVALAQGANVGPYIGAGVSMAFEDFDLPSGVSADDSLALDLLGGYRMNPAVALEAELQFLDEFDLDGIGGDVDGVALIGSAKLFPLQGTAEIEPFILAGLGFVDLDGPGAIDADDDDWMIQFGAGLDFPIAERSIFELRATYRFPQDDVDDFDYWTLGANLQYRF